MKILALNSSPRAGEQSKTALMLHRLVEGMRDAGAEVEVVNLREKKIKNCVGCFTCWTKTPGVCIHKDDMSGELLAKWLESDIAIYATPLYNYAMTATLKTFQERTLPASMPFFEIRGSRMHHPDRGKCPAIVVLSVSGMPDEAHFSALSAHMRYCHAHDHRLLAEIYRPAAEIMTNSFLGEKTDDVLNATTEAGRELVRNKKISPETMARITQPLVEPGFYTGVVNVFWKTCIAEGVTPKEFEKKKMAPRPDSLESFLHIFPLGLDAKAAGDRKTVIQFVFPAKRRGHAISSLKMDTSRRDSEKMARPI
jgi:multimeric flavodoxin WrbA